MRGVFVTAIVATLIAACTQAAAQLVPDVEPTLVNEITEPAMAEGHEKLGGAVILYQRSGGFAGISEQWTIYPDGRIVSGDGQERKVSAEEVSALLIEIGALGFFDLRDSGGLPNTCADCFSHQITASSDGGLNQITVAGAGYDPQDPRWQVVQKISDFISGLSSE